MRPVPRWAIPVLPGLILFLAVLIPSIGIIVALSFHTFVPGNRPLAEFTLDNYLRLAEDTYYAGILAKSLAISTLAAAISTLIAYPMAYQLIRSQRMRRIILPTVALSFFVSGIVLLTGWVGILGRRGILNETLIALGLTSRPIELLYTDTAVLIGMSAFTIPFSVLILASSINNVDPTLEEGAQSLGAQRWQTALRITLPLTRSGILGSLVLSFALSISAILTPIILGGGRVPLLSTVIYDAMKESFNYPFATAALVVLLITIFLAVSTLGRSFASRGL